MAKQLSFKKVVQSTYDSLQSLRGHVGDKKIDELYKVFVPHILEYIFNQITMYPKDTEKIRQETINRAKEYVASICMSCGKHRADKAGIATDGLTKKRITCPFHE